MLERDATGDLQLPAGTQLLAARVGHQFANLLTPMSGCFELLRHHPENLTDFADTLPLLDQIAQRMSIHVQDLFLCRRKPVSVTRPVSIAECLRQAVVILHATGLADGHDVQLNLKEADSQATVLAADRLLTHLFVNLLVNAAEAMRPSGMIAIAIGHDPSGLTVSIRDSGSGITDDNRDRVFEPFFSTKGNSTGIGLGLFVARHLAEQFNATIHLLPVTPTGTEATVRFARLPT